MMICPVKTVKYSLAASFSLKHMIHFLFNTVVLNTLETTLKYTYHTTHIA